MKAWSETNQDYIKEYHKRYRLLNRNKIQAHNALRRARKLQATPKWINLKEIEEFYLNRADGMHVDHIIPLKNDKVCGLHVLWNLQYLTPSENSAKKNKF